MPHDHWILVDREPVPVDLHTWAAWFEKFDRQVGRTMVGDLLVSTVFLGLDHNFYGGPPLLFESMVFKDGLDTGILCWRYSTWEEAEGGHKAAVAKAKEHAPDALVLGDCVLILREV